MKPEDIEKLIKSYKDENSETWLYGQERGNCGVISSDFMIYCERKGVNAPRIAGAFIIDTPTYDKLDFTEEEIEDLRSQGYDFESLDERKNYVKNNNLEASHKYIPHYWNVIDGDIIDLSGKSQFVDTGFSEELSSDRYIAGDYNVILDKALTQTQKKSSKRKRGP